MIKQNKGKLSILSYLEETKEFNDILNNLDTNISSIRLTAILTALAFNKKKKKMFFLFPSLYQAQEFVTTINDYLDEEDVYLYSSDDLFRLNNIYSSKEMNNERLASINSIFSDKPSILVSHISASLINICSKEIYLQNNFEIKLHDEITKKELISKFYKSGYLEVDHILLPGQFAYRGQIIDFYNPSNLSPVRIEIFGDEITDIREFSLDNEESFNSLEKVKISPSSLFLLTDDEIQIGLKKIEEEINNSKDNLEVVKQSFESLKEKVIHSTLNESESRFYSFFTSGSTLLEYVTSYDKYLYDEEEISKAKKSILYKQDIFFTKSISNGTSIRGEKIYSDKATFTNYIKIGSNDTDLTLRDCSYYSNTYTNSLSCLNRYLEEGYKIRIALSQPMLNNYINYLEQNKVDYSLYPKHSTIMLYEGNLSCGFELPSSKHVYLTLKELFGVNTHKSKFLSRYKESKVIRRFDELEVGDYVVHEVHGIGKYLGIKEMDGLEYLKVLYQDDAFLFIPLSQYKLIRKYSSKDSFVPSLDKIGGSTWSRKKSKIRSRINYLADQLLEIYAARRKNIGYSFNIDEELINEYLSSFPFPYTKSQLKCIEEIKEDMKSNLPMDRLITGDVGFGKTELAFFASFIAISNSKQVAFLCPTTILSMQHYKNALARLSQFNIRICLFSRLVPLKEQKKNIELIKKGKIDLIIGTHRLLSSSIEFKDLGLLIIDEEQRFGVTHKEKIKNKIKNIDTLTLSATPIPRTLQMSLLNIRQISYLEEPPLNRLPVKTYVIKNNEEILFEAIERELSRKGQIYFLHNKISDLEKVKSKLQKHFPNNIIEICHGQLDEEEIEQIMNNFYLGNIDILICTSIIESGLDVANVNTIIVENSQNFGLAQLYQIKGRVGRSDIFAYAYFFYDEEKEINDVARLRLKALKNFTELGSGYKIALQDLNIRGAGDILGSEQAGFVDTLGYDAYIDLINSVVREKELLSQGKKEESTNFELSFSLDAIIPTSYCSTKDRLTIYSELYDIKTSDELAKYESKVKDVYGIYPVEVSNLFLKRKIEINLNSGLFSSFKENLGYYSIISSDLLMSKEKVYLSWEEKLNIIKPLLRISVQDNHFVFTLTKTKNYLEELLFLTEQINSDFYNK